MPYDENFYQKYHEYLQEPAVRKNHNHIFELFALLLCPNSPRVVDLGCGLGEYPTYDSHHSHYVGLDLNDTNAVTPLIQTNYMALNFRQLLPFSPNAFISLFSIECCQPATTRYDLYNRIFSEFPTIRHGLVGGFFYQSKRDQETVSETGEIISYQTIEDPSLYISNLFTELRIHLHTPSQMFGRDVVEVWKLFIRK